MGFEEILAQNKKKLTGLLRLQGFSSPLHPTPNKDIYWTGFIWSDPEYI